MKKQLLLATAFGAVVATVAASANKDAVLAGLTPVEQKAVVNDADMKAEPAAALRYDAVKFDAATALSATALREDGDDNGDDDEPFVPQPYYYLAQSSLYTCNLLDYGTGFNTMSSIYNVLPGDCEVTWKNLSGYTGTLDINNLNMSWSYQYFYTEGSSLYRGTSTATYDTSTGDNYNLVAPAPTFYAGRYSLAAPTLTFNDSTYTNSDGLWSYGPTSFNFGSTVGTSKVGLTALNYNFYAGNASSALSSAAYYEFARGTFSNWSLGSTFPYSDTKFRGAAMRLTIPDGAAFGLEKVYFETYVSAELTSDIKLDIYRIDTTGKLGERLGGGYLSASDVTPNTSSYQRIGVPIITSDGELEEQSFLNITGDVLVVISGPDGLRFNTLMMNSTGRWHNSAYYILDLFDSETNEVTGTNYLSAASNQTWTVSTDGAKVVSFCFFYDGEYTIIEADDDVDALEVTLPADGGKKSLTLYPYNDFFTASRFSGEGVDEWLYVYADEEQNTETAAQDLVFEAEALPAGVSGRATKVLVEIPGAQVTVTVKQGDTSGIDTIDGDAADVVASQIYDLQGRQLNVVPESGLYIRRDVKADNTVSTSKIVK